LEIDPLNSNFNATILLNKAIGHFKLKSHMESLKDLNQCLEFKPDYSKALVKRSEIHLELEDYEEAVRDLE
jgi:tetratricopeptide (TPR) repeat protein